MKETIQELVKNKWLAMSKPINVILVILYICIAFLWIAIDMMACEFVSKMFPGKYNDGISACFYVMLFFIIVFGSLVAIYKKKNFFFLIFYTALIAVFTFPSSEIVRSLYRREYEKEYQAAAVYAVTEFIHSKETEILLPEELRKLATGEYVYILFGDEELVVVFFPAYLDFSFLRFASIREGFICYYDRKTAEETGSWKASWQWRDDVRREELLEPSTAEFWQ